MMLDSDLLPDNLTQFRVNDLYLQHAERLSDDELEKWPELYAENCTYRLISRVNHDRALPLAVILAESRGSLVDRVTAIRNTMVFAPRVVNHAITGIRILSQHGDLVRSRSQFSVCQTLGSGITQLQLVGRSFDTIDLSHDTPLFVERLAIFDTELIPGSVVYPI